MFGMEMPNAIEFYDILLNAYNFQYGIRRELSELRKEITAAQ